MTKDCLVADDVRHNRVLAGGWLTGLGHTVREAANGKDAWEMVLTHLFDLLVTDIEMPGQSGLELLKHIRQHGDEKVAGMPVIVMSSLQDGRLEETALGFGATSVVRKPLAEDEFLGVVQQVLSVETSEFQGGGDASTESSGSEHGPISPTLRRLVDRARRNQ